MAHEIEKMISNTGSKQSAVLAPWHGLADMVDTRTMTLEEIAERANLHLKVNRQYVYVKGSKLSEVADVRLPNVLALIREDGKHYGMVSERYKVEQAMSMLKFFKEYCEAGEMMIETAGSLKDGAVVFVMAHINHGTDFTLKGGDVIKGNVVLCNSYDGSISYQGFCCSIAVVCMNTLRAAMRGDKKGLFKMRATNAKHRDAILKAAKADLQRAINQMKGLHESATTLSEAKVDLKGPEVRSYVYNLVNGASLLEDAVAATPTKGGSILETAMAVTDIQKKLKKATEIKDEDLGRVGKSILDAMINSPGSNLESRNNTWWGAVNGVTYHADHKAGHQRDTAMQSAWFGNNAKLKDSALELALQYAEATR